MIQNFCCILVTALLVMTLLFDNLVSGNRLSVDREDAKSHEYDVPLSTVRYLISERQTKQSRNQRISFKDLNLRPLERAFGARRWCVDIYSIELPLYHFYKFGFGISDFS